MHKIDNTEIIKRIEKALSESGMRKDAFYEKSGVSSATMSQWRSNIYRPSPAKLYAVSNVLGVTVDYLLTGEEEQKNPTPVTESGKSDLDVRLDKLLSAADDDFKRVMLAALEQHLQNK